MKKIKRVTKEEFSRLGMEKQMKKAMTAINVRGGLEKEKGES
jgi:hypothetical protein